MTPTDPTALDPTEFLTSRRLGVAIGALADPSRDQTQSVADLDEQERHAIRQALGRSSHPLVGFANHLLDDWDLLADDDRTAGLLLFAQLTKTPGRRRNTARGMER